MRIGQRMIIEYILLLCAIIGGTLLGSLHPVSGLQTAHNIRHLFSVPWLFSSNSVVVIAIFLCSVFTGGIVGLIILFLNTFLYGSVISIYNQAFWPAFFPWLEIISLTISIQIGADTFWALLLKWPLRPKLIASLVGTSILLLAIAAFIEGGILNV